MAAMWGGDREHRMGPMVRAREPERKRVINMLTAAGLWMEMHVA
jgi:hypothetical protein